MLILKYIISLAVSSIILLHTAIPHEHEDNSNTAPAFRSHECSTTIFDGVKLTFRLDHGDGHLEHFVKIITVKPKLTISGTLEIVFVDSNLKFTNNETIIYSDLNPSPDLLRGPPC